MVKKGRRSSRKKLKEIPVKGVVHIAASYNNTILTMTDEQGNALLWSSTGSVKHKGTRKKTLLAAQDAIRDLGSRAYAQGMREVVIQLCGAGKGRKCYRVIRESGLRITRLRDITGIPYNGCRPRKYRRTKGNARRRRR